MTVPGYRRLILPAALTAAAFAAYSLSPSANGAAGRETTDAIAGAVRYGSGVIAWLAVAWLAARALDLLLYRAALSGPRPSQYPRLLSDLVHGVLFVLAAVAIFVFVFRQAATGFVATSSVLIAVIGFALRYIISDVFSGIALNFDRPYRIGDWMEPAPGQIGRVAEITWRTTRLATREGTTIVVPNGLIATGRLVNYSDPEPAFRISLRLPLDARVPVERAKHVLLAGALGATRVFPDLRPDVLAQDCSEGAVTYAVRFWVPDYGSENACRDAVLTGVLEALRCAGLAVSAPRRDVMPARAAPLDGRKRPPVVDLLRHIAPFRAFTSEELTALAEQIGERPLREGAMIVREGEPGGSLYVVAEGALEVRVRHDGAELAIDRLSAGDVFGEISLLTGEPRHATVVALTDGLLYEVRKEDIAPLLRRRPELGEGLAAIMSDRQHWNRSRLRSLDRAIDAAPAPSAADLLRRLRSFFGLSAAR